MLLLSLAASLLLAGPAPAATPVAQTEPVPLLAAAPAGTEATFFEARDTLNITPDGSPKVQQMLDAIAWKPQPFQVAVAPATLDPRRNPLEFKTDADALVYFASPHPREQKEHASNTVVMEWYKAKFVPGQRAAVRAPAVLVLHIMDYRLITDRGVAEALSKQGINAFLMHLPDYGLRYGPESRFNGETFLTRIRQAVGDARRARDAIAALPRVDPRRISLDGTSLGAFVGAGAASLDNAFENTYLVLCGGDLCNMLLKGEREAAWVRQSLERAGYTGDRFREVVDQADPGFLVHRLNPARTWLFTARSDQVIPEFSSTALAASAKLQPDHHIMLAGDHYTSLLSLPWTSARLAATIHADDAPPPKSP